MLTVAVRLTERWFTSTLPARRVAFVMPLALLLWCYGTVQDSLSFALGWDERLAAVRPAARDRPHPAAFVGGVLYARGLRSRVADLVIVARDKVDRGAVGVESRAHAARQLAPGVLVGRAVEGLPDLRRRAGCPTAPPPDRPGRSTLAIDSDQGPIALIEHDVALSQDDRLLDAVSSALLLSVDNDRLRQRLERTLQEVRESRLRIVEEGYLARRRLERDLHDGSQQQLVSLAIRLRIATAKAQAARQRRGRGRPASGHPPSWRMRCANCANWRAASTRRCSPTATCARRSTELAAAQPPARRGERRRCASACREVVEETIYYCVAECLANAAKHARPATARSP